MGGCLTALFVVVQLLCVIYFVSAYDPSTCIQCRKSHVCNPPDCFCCRDTMPLESSKIPQMVFFTFDDAVNPAVAKHYKDLFDSSRLNPNGCPVRMTLFISHRNTVYSYVRDFYERGMEIASHSVTHSHPNSQTFLREAKKQKENLARKAKIPESEIVGWRSPFLEPLGDTQPKVLKQLGYTYDATLTITKKSNTDKAITPFTLDHGWPYDCKIKPCPAQAHSGFWEVPVVSVKDYKNKYDCVYIDACHSPPPSESAAYKFLWDNFQRYYSTNRAPMGINMHASWFYYPDRKAAMDKFIKQLVKMDDVYILTVKQVIEWLKDPTPLSNIKTFKPWQCGANTNETIGAVKSKTLIKPTKRTNKQISGTKIQPIQVNEPKQTLQNQRLFNQNTQRQKQFTPTPMQTRLPMQNNGWQNQMQNSGFNRQPVGPTSMPFRQTSAGLQPQVWSRGNMNGLPPIPIPPMSPNFPAVRFWWRPPAAMMDPQMQMELRRREAMRRQRMMQEQQQTVAMQQAQLQSNQRAVMLRRQEMIEKRRQSMLLQQKAEEERLRKEKLEQQRQEELKKQEVLKQKEIDRKIKEEKKRQLEQAAEKQRQEELAKQELLKQQQLEQQRLEEQLRQDRIKQEQLEKQKQEELARQELLKQQQLEKQRIEEQLRQDRIKQEQLEKQRQAELLKQQQLKQQRLEEQARQDRIKQEQLEQQRQEELRQKALQQQLEQQRLEEKLVQERLQKEKLQRQEQLKQQQLENQRREELQRRETLAKQQNQAIKQQRQLTEQASAKRIQEKQIITKTDMMSAERNIKPTKDIAFAHKLDKMLSRDKTDRITMLQQMSLYELRLLQYEVNRRMTNSKKPNKSGLNPGFESTTHVNSRQNTAAVENKASQNQNIAQESLPETLAMDTAAGVGNMVEQMVSGGDVYPEIPVMAATENIASPTQYTTKESLPETLAMDTAAGVGNMVEQMVSGFDVYPEIPVMAATENIASQTQYTTKESLPETLAMDTAAGVGNMVEQMVSGGDVYPEIPVMTATENKASQNQYIAKEGIPETLAMDTAAGVGNMVEQMVSGGDMSPPDTTWSTMSARVMAEVASEIVTTTLAHTAPTTTTASEETTTANVNRAPMPSTASTGQQFVDSNHISVTEKPRTIVQQKTIPVQHTITTSPTVDSFEHVNNKPQDVPFFNFIPPKLAPFEHQPVAEPPVRIRATTERTSVWHMDTFDIQSLHGPWERDPTPPSPEQETTTKKPVRKTSLKLLPVAITLFKTDTFRQPKPLLSYRSFERPNLFNPEEPNTNVFPPDAVPVSTGQTLEKQSQTEQLFPKEKRYTFSEPVNILPSELKRPSQAGRQLVNTVPPTAPPTSSPAPSTTSATTSTVPPTSTTSTTTSTTTTPPTPPPTTTTTRSTTTKAPVKYTPRQLSSRRQFTPQPNNVMTLVPIPVQWRLDKLGGPVAIPPYRPFLSSARPLQSSTNMNLLGCRQGDNCALPNCFCKTDSVPLGMKLREIPQIVYITIDGSLNFHGLAKIRKLFSGRTNPNGCKVKGTMFITDAGSSYRISNLLLNDGIELAMMGMSSRQYTNKDKLTKDMLLQRQRISESSNMAQDRIHGWRSPEFKTLGDDQFSFMANESLYDSSLVLDRSSRDKRKVWPFTLDYGLNELCEIGQCPSKHHQGMWEVPVIPYLGPNNSSSCEYVDGCTTQPKTATDTFNYLMDNFNMHYKTNRAPFAIRLKQIWFHWYYRENLKGLFSFLDTVLGYGDVYLSSISDMLQWIKNPVKLQTIDAFKPWKC